MKIIKFLALTFFLSLGIIPHSYAGGSLYTDILGVTHYSNGVTSQTDSIGNTHTSNGVTYYTDSIGNTHYSDGLNGVTGSSYTDSIGATHFIFSDGATITKQTDSIGNTYYVDNKGRTGNSYTDAIGNTHYSGSLFPDQNQVNSNINSCTSTELLSVRSKYNIDVQEQQINDLKNQIKELDTQRKLIPIQLNKEMSGSGASDGGAAPILASRLRENNSKTVTLNIRLEDAQTKYNSDYLLIEGECSRLKAKKQTESNYVSQVETGLKCADGYIAFGNTCIDNSSNCMNKYGKNSYYNDGKCQCVLGYKMDFYNTKCVSVFESSCQQNASSVNGKCTCNAGTISDGANCITMLVYCKIKYGLGVSSNGLSCSCPQGQLFDGVKCLIISKTIPAPKATVKKMPTFTKDKITSKPTANSSLKIITSTSTSKHIVPKSPIS